MNSKQNIIVGTAQGIKDINGVYSEVGEDPERLNILSENMIGKRTMQAYCPYLNNYYDNVYLHKCFYDFELFTENNKSFVKINNIDELNEITKQKLEDRPYCLFPNTEEIMKQFMFCQEGNQIDDMQPLLGSPLTGGHSLIVQLQMGIMYFSPVPDIMYETLPPTFHATDNVDWLLGGRLPDLHAWPRFFQAAFRWKDNKKPCRIAKGTVMCYGRLTNLKNVFSKIQAKRIKNFQEISNHIEQNLIKFRYDKVPMQKIIKANSFKPIKLET